MHGYLQCGCTREVTMMRKNGSLEYGQGDDFKAVRLPYGSGKSSMYAILPDEDVLINDFIVGMSLPRIWMMKISVVIRVRSSMYSARYFGFYRVLVPIRTVFEASKDGLNEIK